MISNKDYRFKKRDSMYLVPKESLGLIWSDECSSFLPWKNFNSYCMFRRTFNIEKRTSSAKIKVIADCKMCLYVNGKYVKRSLYSGLNSARIYDEIDITEYIEKGKNVLAFLALHYGYDTFYGQASEPGLLYQCRIVLEDGEKININSDENTKAKLCDFYESKSAKISENGGCVEIIDYRKYSEDWYEVDFDDSSWHNAKSNSIIFPSSSHPKRMTDKIVENKHKGKAIISAHVAEKSNKELLIDRIKEEVNKCHLSNMYMVDLACEIKPSEPDKFSCVVVKFSEERRGRILVDCNGFGGEIVDVVYLKGFEEGNSEICGVSEFILKAGENHLQPNFDDYVFDYAMLIVRNHVQTLKINNVEMIADRYVFDNFMEFASENKFFGEMFENIKSSIKNTYMCETVYYKGTEPTWHLCGTRWQNLAYSVIAGDDVHFKRNIIKYAELINEKGYRKKTFSNNRSDIMALDSMVWISSFGDLVDLTDETYLFERYLNRIISTLRWLTNFENKEGLICFYKEGDFCSTIINCIYLDTIASVVKISKRIDAIGEYTYYKAKYRSLLKILKENFWNEEKGVYCDGLKNGIQLEGSSCDSNTFAILSLHNKGERRIKTILDNLFINKEISITHKESFVKAMLKAGRQDIVIKELRNGLGAAAEGIFFVEGLLGVDMKNLKGGSINPLTKEELSYKAKLKTRFKTYEIEVKNSKFKIR